MLDPDYVEGLEEYIDLLESVLKRHNLTVS